MLLNQCLFVYMLSQDFLIGAVRGKEPTQLFSWNFCKREGRENPLKNNTNVEIKVQR